LPQSRPELEAPLGAKSFRFPKSIRIRARPDYLRVQRHGVRLSSRNLLVFYRSGNKDTARFGITVSKKVGNAVMRNRVKRWLREAIRHHQYKLEVPIDVVFIASPRAARASYRSIELDVSNALIQIAGAQ
jgi:ribonuclease P protein component